MMCRLRQDTFVERIPGFPTHTPSRPSFQPRLPELFNSGDLDEIDQRER